MDQKPSIGRTVHYVLNEGRNPGEHRPAIIVKVWEHTPEILVQLQVFTDSDKAGIYNDALSPVLWTTSIKQSQEA